MKPVEIVLRMGEGDVEERWKGESNWHIISTCVNVTMNLPVQLIYAN
jgi:hypothetical protein